MIALTIDSPSPLPPDALALRALDLTDAQREQVRQLTLEHRERTRALLERVQAAQEAQPQAMDAISFSEPQIRAAMQALAEAQSELAVQQARLQSDIYALLMPEQQERLQKMRRSRGPGEAASGPLPAAPATVDIDVPRPIADVRESSRHVQQAFRKATGRSTHHS